MAHTLEAVLKVLLAVAIPLAAFALGLRAAKADATYLLKRPGLLARALVTILVIVPVGAMLLMQFFHASAVTSAGIMIAVISIGMGPAAAFKKFKGDENVLSFEVGLNVILLAVAILFIPIFLSIHGTLYHHDVRLGVVQVAKVVLLRALIPLVLGIIAGNFFPKLVPPATKYAGAFVQLVMMAVVVVALLSMWRALVGLGIKTWLICAVVVVAEIAISHAAGGPTPETRRTLATFGVMRFPALALLLAAAAPRGREFVPVILAYIMVSMAVVALYGAATSARRVSSGGSKGAPALPGGRRPAHSGRA